MNGKADLGSLSEQVILVTGAAAGIGRTLAKGFAAEGATVVLLDKNRSALESLYDEIEAAGFPQPALYPMDLLGATQQDHLDLAQRLDETFGMLHGLLHNAAYLGFLSRIDDYDVELWFRAMQVNLNAPFLLTQACLPLLRQAPRASIIFTSDTVGRKGRAYWGAYAVAKAGIERLMEVLADELRDTSAIRVNSIDPGPTRTGLRHQAFPAEDPASLKSPESLLPIYLWAMSPETKDINGRALSFDDTPHRQHGGNDTG
jgi:NAD(P)-dependent dehydrogenase (short-subunit alcohol dehydrogenase family)